MSPHRAHNAPPRRQPRRRTSCIRQDRRPRPSFRPDGLHVDPNRGRGEPAPAPPTRVSPQKPHRRMSGGLEEDIGKTHGGKQATGRKRKLRDTQVVPTTQCIWPIFVEHQEGTIRSLRMRPREYGRQTPITPKTYLRQHLFSRAATAWLVDVHVHVHVLMHAHMHVHVCPRVSVCVCMCETAANTPITLTVQACT